MRETYDLSFLREKEFFEKEQALKEKLPSGEQVTCVFDPDNRMVYFEEIKRENIGEVVKHLKERFNFDYYWFWEEGRLIVFRTFGENKQFIFNIERARERGKTEYLKSKIKKLREFSIDNSNILFDVKDVVDQFYKMLWIIRIKLAKTIQDDISDKEKILSAQRLIDRLIFTYFLGEKGIIKGKDKRGREILPDVKELFKYLLETSKDFHKLLNKIFFEFLNSEVKNEMPIPEIEEFSLIIPYLNGGLFREKILKTKTGKPLGESKLHFEGFDWGELIKELNQYNWIIEEYVTKEDEETIGNLTPEILGHIYEKFVISFFELGEINVDDLSITRKGELKKGRKKMGAYYTPENVVKYISENTLFPYILEKMGLDRKFISFTEFYTEFRNNTRKLKELDKYLLKIKILDPAVGSGHFLMSIAELLFDWRKKCGIELDDYSLRKDIIKNNLYGVDIMEGAVEICKLRLWLWLIASLSPNSEPEALPNIDFNIREGNSLIGFSEERAKIGKQELLITYFLREDLNQYNIKINRYKDDPKQPELMKKELDELNNKMQEKLDKWYSQAFTMKINHLRIMKSFHWVMEFPGVFKERKGFDIVIGNPPYGKLFKRNEYNIINKIFPYSSPSKDISATFIERSASLLNKQGKFGMIVPLNILRIERFYDIRRFLVEENIPYLIRDEGNPFAGQVELEMVTIFYDFKKREKISVEANAPIMFISDGVPIQKIREYDYRFMIYWDEIYEEIKKESDIGKIKVSQGVPRRANYQEEGEYICLSARSLDPFIIKLNDIEKDRRVTEKFVKQRGITSHLKEGLITPFSLGTTGKITDLAFECVLKPENYLPDGTSIHIKTENSLNIKYLLLLLNSQLINYVTCRYILSYGVRIFRNYLFYMLPIKIKRVELMSLLSNIMLFLNQYYYNQFKMKGKENHILKEKIEFFDKLSNCLVYEIYLEDRLGTKLKSLIVNEPMNISYDDWIKLVIKSNLTDEEKSRKEKIEEGNIKNIVEFFNNLRNNNAVLDEMETILKDPWIEIIEKNGEINQKRLTPLQRV